MATPKLRFKEFDGDWQIDTISSVFTNKSKSFKPQEETNLPCIELEHLSQGTGTILGTVDSKEQQSTKNLFEPNSVLYGKLRPYLRKFAQPQFKGVCSSEIWVLNGIKIENNYLYQYIQSEHFTELTNIQSGSKMPRADWRVVSSSDINYPSLKEQTKIATFLSAVDTKIDELTQKHELLTDYKKGMMQQIFSQKLRFKADDGSDFKDWEETNLGEICSHFKSGKSITSRNISTAGKFAVYGGNGLRGYTDSFTHEGKFILVGRQGALCGNVNVVDGNNYISEHAIAIQANQNNSTDWLAYWLDKMKLNRFSESSAQAGLAVNKLVKFKIELPSLPEQTKIANFLTAIDQKIDNVAEQIDHAKTWKKGLLQQMFV